MKAPKKAAQKKPAVYDHLKIEKKWQKEWDQNGIYKAPQKSTKKKMYVLDMFPYPSGAGLHVGHPRGYIGTDVYSRKKRMEGFNVLHPMGFDSFGLPAEQYAISTGKNPGPFTEHLVKHYQKQLSILGFSYDWDRMVATHRPEYYKWTQWIFLKLYEAWYDTKKQKARPIAELISILEKKGNADVTAACDSDTPIISAKEWKAFTPKEHHDFLMKYRLAYEGYSEVNWSPELGTVLANDEIVDGPNGPVSERGGHPVEKKMMRQWFMRITAYAERLLDGLEVISWPEHIKEIERNWIGKSEGMLFTAKVKDIDLQIQTFSAHFEAFKADTFVVIAPDHPILKKLLEGTKEAHDVLSFAQKIVVKRDSTPNYKEIEGIFTGRYLEDPVNGVDIPIWVASFALKDYGTGIVKCSCHDERDFAFAKKYNIPLKPVLFPRDAALAEKVKNLEVCYTDMQNGVLAEPKELAGPITGDTRGKVIAYLESHNLARRVTSYKMRDAIFARQRYWGEPIPLKHNADGTIIPLKESQLPLKLPNVKSYEPSGTGESPLASISSWTKAGYETNTMPGWAGSSWYFLRYMDPKNKKQFASPGALSYWKDVDVYVGGAEHATGHLLYARFWHMVLHDLGYVPTKEPVKMLRNQGLILATDGRKMSKRWGNVINPDDIVNTYGADTLRVYEMFMGPFEASLPWSTESIIGSRRFIERVWRLKDRIGSVQAKDRLTVQKALHKSIKKVTEDVDQFAFNTAVSSMMICLNEMEKTEVIHVDDFKSFLKLFAPFAPHVSDELWRMLGEKKSIHVAPWPSFNKKYLEEDTVTIGVQVNGKTRDELTIPVDASKEAIENAAKALPRIKAILEGQSIKKVIVVPGRIINIVV